MKGAKVSDRRLDDPVIYEVDAIKNNITMVRIAFILMFFMLLCSKNCSAQEEIIIDLGVNGVVEKSSKIDIPIFKINCKPLKAYIKKVIEDDMQKSPNESRYSHAILYFFDSNDNSFKVVAQFYSRKKAYLSSEYYGVAYVNNIPVFICGDTPFILKPLKKKESYKKTQGNNYLIIDPLTEIYLYRKATKSFIRIG